MMPIETREPEVDAIAIGESRDDGESVDLVALLTILAKRKLWILRATLLATAFAAIVAFLLPNRYTARTRILPPQQNQSIAAMVGGQLAAMGPLAAAAGKDMGLKSPGELYVGMLKSDTIEENLVRRYDLMRVYRKRRLSDAMEELEKNSTIASGKDGMISIAVEDPDRQRAAKLANAYVEELQALAARVAVTEAGQRRLFFETQVKQASNTLADAEQALKATQQKTGIIEMDSQAKAIVDSVVAVKAQIAAKEVEVQSMRTFAAERNPDLALVNQELAGLRAQLTKLERQQSQGTGDLQVPTGKIPELGLEYLRRARDLKYAESVYELLSKQYEVARIDEAREGAIVQVVDYAKEPDKRSSPKRSLIILVVAVLMLIACSTWVLLVASVQRLREFEPTQAERLTQLSALVLGRWR